MTEFPVLKTGAIMQLPASRTIEFATEIVQFVDGSEQRFRNYGRPCRRWMIGLQALDETEVQGLRNFVVQMNGATGEFSFKDPWDGTMYPSCSIEGGAVADVLRGPMSAAMKLVIRENRK